MNRFPKIGCALILMLPSASLGGQQHVHPSTSIASLRTFLQGRFPDDRTIRFRATAADLRDNGNEESILYLTGDTLCGSGGCVMLVISRHAHGFDVMAHTTITRLPIRVLPTKTNGWHDIGVFVAGGGINPGYVARLRFNGHSYPSNPSVPPATPLHDPAAGKTILTQKSPDFPVYL